MIRRLLTWCRIDFQSKITTPRTGYFVRNESSVRLCYIIDGQYRYINLATPLEVARLLKRHGVIQWFASKDDYQVKMYIQELVTTIGANMEPVQVKKPKLTPFTWQQIELTSYQVQTIAAAHELSVNEEIKKCIKDFFQAA